MVVAKDIRVLFIFDLLQSSMGGGFFAVFQLYHHRGRIGHVRDEHNISVTLACGQLADDGVLSCGIEIGQADGALQRLLVVVTQCEITKPCALVNAGTTACSSPSMVASTKSLELLTISIICL